MRLRLVTLVLAGCGRLGFDAPSDATALSDSPTGHDEDGDGIVDADDPCPHLPGTATDADGDQVGDACDPEPTLARQRIALFATMQADQPFALQGDGVWTSEPDAWHFIGNVGVLRIERPFGAARVRIGVDILARLGAANEQHQFAFGIGTEVPPSYFAEVNEGPGYSNASVTLFDGTTYSSAATVPLANGVHTGVFELQFDGTLSPAAVSMEGGWENEPYTAGVAGASYAGGTNLQMNSNRLAYRVRYVIIIDTL